MSKRTDSKKRQDDRRWASITFRIEPDRKSALKTLAVDDGGDISSLLRKLAIDFLRSKGSAR